MVSFVSSEWTTAFLQHHRSQLLKWRIASSSSNKQPGQTLLVHLTSNVGTKYN